LTNEFNRSIPETTPVNSGELGSVICNTCAFFKKRGDCKKGLLNAKTAPVKFNRCEKHFPLGNVQNMHPGRVN
jgi:hypothetical protein